METCRHVGTHGTVMKCTKSLIVIIVVVRIVRIVRIVFILAPVSRSRITYNVHGVLASLLPYTALHSTAQHSTAQHSTVQILEEVGTGQQIYAGSIVYEAGVLGSPSRTRAIQSSPVQSSAVRTQQTVTRVGSYR